MRWIKSFDKTLPDLPLPERTKEDVQAYMDVLIRRNKYQDWQMKQANEALRLLFSGYDICTVKELLVLEHSDVSTTMICYHIIQQRGYGRPIPLDDLNL